MNQLFIVFVLLLAITSLNGYATREVVKQECNVEEAGE